MSFTHTQIIFCVRTTFLTIPNLPSNVGLNNTGQSGGLPDADIDAPEAWNLTHGSNDVVVAVIDSGVYYDHPDLAANIWENSQECNGASGVDDDGNGYVDDCHGIDTVNGDSDPMDDKGAKNGTHVAGIIAAVGNNSVGVTGVNWNAKIMPCKFLNSAGSGSSSGEFACIQYVADMKDTWCQYSGCKLQLRWQFRNYPV